MNQLFLSFNKLLCLCKNLTPTPNPRLSVTYIIILLVFFLEHSEDAGPGSIQSGHQAGWRLPGTSSPGGQVLINNQNDDNNNDNNSWRFSHAPQYTCVFVSASAVTNSVPSGSPSRVIMHCVEFNLHPVVTGHGHIFGLITCFI